MQRLGRRGGLISKTSGSGSIKKGVKDGEETQRRCPQDKDRLPVGTGDGRGARRSRALALVNRWAIVP